MNDNLHRQLTCLDKNYTEKDSQKVTMNSLLAAVFDLPSQDLLEKRVKNNISEMH